jgi:hypothetical protein
MNDNDNPLPAMGLIFFMAIVFILMAVYIGGAFDKKPDKKA